MDRAGARTPAAEVGILLYPQCYGGMVGGMTDLLQVAGDFSVARGGPPLRLTHWALDASGAIGRVSDTHPGSVCRLSVAIAPALALDRVPGPVDVATAAPFAAWLAARHAEGTTLAATGCGTFVLAAAGVLAGRPATTHWRYADTLRQSFPDVTVDADKVLIDDGDILTAGGMMAWTDLGMRLVDRLLGPAVMMDAAQFWLIDPAGREQRHYGTFVPRLGHGDAPILTLQRRLQADPTRAVTVAAMAREAAMETRTFLRRFKAATGLTPTAYLQQLRVGRARELLQFSRQGVDQVAWTVGYRDAGAFRRVFLRIVGLSPSEYRRRFGASRGTGMAA